MKSGIRLLTMLGAIVVAFSQLPSTAYAQASRTWVSGVGDDANPCSRTAPCKTFAGAISKTAASGEIDVLDPGGFGALTITKGITIDGGGGQVASVLVAGTNGINVAAGVNDVVTLRNLRINGLAGTATPGLDGIVFTSGAALIVEKCDIFGFQFNGIHYIGTGTRKLVIMNTALTNNVQSGMQINPTGGTGLVSLSDVNASKNGFGIGIDSTGGSTLSLFIDRSMANANTSNGLQVAGAGSFVQIGRSVFSQNATGVNVTAPAQAKTTTDNAINQNTTVNVNGTLTPTPYQ